MTAAHRKPMGKRTGAAPNRETASQLQEAATGRADSFLRSAVAAVEGSIGPLRHFNAMQVAGSYVHACATLHAAEMVAAALDRNTAALAALIKSQTH